METTWCGCLSKTKRSPWWELLTVTLQMVIPGWALRLIQGSDTDCPAVWISFRSTGLSTCRSRDFHSHTRLAGILSSCSNTTMKVNHLETHNGYIMDLASGEVALCGFNHEAELQCLEHFVFQLEQRPFCLLQLWECHPLAGQPISYEFNLSSISLLTLCVLHFILHFCNLDIRCSAFSNLNTLSFINNQTKNNPNLSCSPKNKRAANGLSFTTRHQRLKPASFTFVASVSRRNRCWPTSATHFFLGKTSSLSIRNVTWLPESLFIFNCHGRHYMQPAPNSQTWPFSPCAFFVFTRKLNKENQNWNEIALLWYLQQSFCSFLRRKKSFVCVFIFKRQTFFVNSKGFSCWRNTKRCLFHRQTAISSMNFTHLGASSPGGSPGKALS